MNPETGDPIKDYFESLKAEEGGEPCPAPERLFAWAENLVAAGEREELVRHAASCPACTEKITLIERLKREGVPEKAVSGDEMKKIRSEIRQKRAKDRKPSAIGRGLWFAGFVGFMLLSFGVPSHFLQMLVIAVVCAAKWLLDTRAQHIYVNVHHRRDSEAPPSESPGRTNRLAADPSRPDNPRPPR